MTALRCCRAAAWGVLLFGPSAPGQEAINTDAATQPSPGHFVVREQFRYARFDDDPTGLGRTADEYTLLTSVTYGLATDTALAVRIPLIYREVESPDPSVDEDVLAVGDIAVTIKQRVFREDSGPINTTRISVLAGLEVPTYSEVSTESWDPSIGGVLTMIRGRHGFSADAEWKFTTGGEEFPLRAGDGTADLLRYDGAYLYRLSPAEYGEDTTAALYGVMELNGLYETNGDNEVFLSPGILWEGTTFAFEASLQVPVIQRLDHRPDTEFVFVIGVRLLF